MNTCPDHIVHYMHEYLDGDISREHELELKAHLQSCDACQKHLHELSKTIAFIKSASIISAPSEFTEKAIARLPKEKSHKGVKRWIRRHPLFVAVAVFCLLMSTSLLSGFKNDDQFSVTMQPNLVVDGQQVVVPEGEVVKGDIVVKNGDLRVEGQVDGDVTVINGQYEYMASTAVVTGQIEEINEAFEWLWYSIKNASKEVISIFDDEQKDK